MPACASPSWLVPEFVPVDLGCFPAGRPPMVDLYHRLGSHHVLYCAADSVFTDAQRHYLRKNHVGELYVRLRSSMPGAGRLHIAQLLALLDRQFPAALRTKVLYSAAIATARIFLSAPDAPGNLAAAQHLATTVATYTLDHPESFLPIVHAMRHDFTAYTHAVNVCAYAVALGRALRLGQDSLGQLSLAALLHDLGKTKVPNAILNKPESLTQEEWATVRRHPEWSVQLLGGDSPSALAVPTVILQHHERADGQGYPRGLKSIEIHPLTRFVTMADAYDALTCTRAYRASRTPYEALRTIKEEMAGQFDRDLFVAFVRLLGCDGK